MNSPITTVGILRECLEGAEDHWKVYFSITEDGEPAIEIRAPENDEENEDDEEGATE